MNLDIWFIEKDMSHIYLFIISAYNVPSPAIAPPLHFSASALIPLHGRLNGRFKQVFDSFDGGARGLFA